MDNENINVTILRMLEDVSELFSEKRLKKRKYALQLDDKIA